MLCGLKAPLQVTMGLKIIGLSNLNKRVEKNEVSTPLRTPEKSQFFLPITKVPMAYCYLLSEDRGHEYS